MKIIIPYTTTSIIVMSIVLVLLVVGGIALFMGSPEPIRVPTAVQAPALVPQSTQEGDVDVSVVHDSASTATVHQFTLTLNTHSGDLSTFDVGTNVVYRTSQGSEIAPQSVGGDRETHHRTIAVTFTDTTLPGNVVVKNLRGIPERSFPFTQ